MTHRTLADLPPDGSGRIAMAVKPQPSTVNRILPDRAGGHHA
ncbi:hypothetical protein [Ralstonia solanacearum]|nr:hypothetical protein [Ralstonia solanacearum]